MATSSQGAEVVKQIAEVKKQSSGSTASDSSAEAKLAQIEQLIAKKKAKSSKAPTSYSLDPISAQPLLMSHAPTFNVQPPVMPQFVQQPQVAQPASFDSLSKKDLIRLLLNELARPDLEK